MNGKSKFHRAFLMLSQEDTGYGAGQTPSGYVKIEVRDGKGKLSAMVQNLKEGQDRFHYRLYILKYHGDSVIPVNAGLIPVNGSTGEIVWQFDPGDVGKSGHGIEGFNHAAVLVEHAGRRQTVIICPLSTYKKAGIDWKAKLKAALYTHDTRQDKSGGETVPLQDTAGICRPCIESRYVPPENQPKANIPGACEHFEPVNAVIEPVMEGLYQPPGSVHKAGTDKHGIVKPETNAHGSGVTDIHDGQAGDTNEDQAAGTSGEERAADAPAAFGEYEQDISADENNLKREEDRLESRLKNDMDRENEAAGGGKPYGGSDAGEEGENTAPACMYTNNGFCTLPASARNANPCADCHLYGRAWGTQNTVSIAEALRNLRECLDDSFERYDPFNSKRKDYVWWRLNNPVKLNDILFQCKIRTPLLFNPMVMMAHFKYRHLIVGIYTDRARRREYIVCGVPGAFNVDERPFGSMCRWVQLEGNRPKYGAFGYWLVYIDPVSGNFLGA